MTTQYRVMTKHGEFSWSPEDLADAETGKAAAEDIHGKSWIEQRTVGPWETKPVEDSDDEFRHRPRPSKKENTMKTEICDSCGNPLEDDTSEDTMRAELEELWPGVKPEDCAVVCEDCWQKLDPRKESNADSKSTRAWSFALWENWRNATEPRRKISTPKKSPSHPTRKEPTMTTIAHHDAFYRKYGKHRPAEPAPVEESADAERFADLARRFELDGRIVYGYKASDAEREIANLESKTAADVRLARAVRRAVEETAVIGRPVLITSAQKAANAGLGSLVRILVEVERTP